MKALYRKYRPLSLDAVVGQEQVVVALKEAIKTDKISHAYIFSGPRGTGKTSIARIFAHEINGFKYELEDNYVDIIEIDAASNTGVDNIRELKEKAVLRPTEGKYKVYIIDEVHMLSKAAWNALLKIVEEPPEHIVFLMATTNPEKIPVTITSRAMNYMFALASSDVMKKHILEIMKKEKLKISDEAVEVVVRRGEGSFRDTISLLDQISTLQPSDGKKISAEDVDRALGLPQSLKVQELLAAYTEGNLELVSSVLYELLNSGVRAEALAKELVEKITENPAPELLHLVSRLFEVEAPFAEAKLLVAFLGEGKAPEIKTFKDVRPIEMPVAPVVQMADAAETAIATAGVQMAAMEAKTAVLEKSQKVENGAKITEEAPEKAVQKSAPTSKTANVALNEKDFVGAIKNAFVKTILGKSMVEISGERVDVYPSSARNVLISARNMELMEQAALGREVVVHEMGEKPEKSGKSASSNGAISAIMGAVEEVDVNGDPFRA